MRDATWSLVNHRTGEMADIMPVRKARHPYVIAWHVVSDLSYGDAMRYLRGAEVHVFAALPLLMRDHNWIRTSQQSIADFTGLSQPAVSKAMQKLKAAEIVAQVDGGWQFSPHIAWKGATAQLRKAIGVWDEAILRQRQARRVVVDESGTAHATT